VAEEGELKKRVCSVIWRAYMDNAEPYKIIVEPTENPANVIDEAKKDLEKQSISLKDAVTVLKDVDQTRIVCFPIETWKKWFGDSS